MFWEIFYNLCLKQGMSPNTVAKEIGISSGALTKWKNEKVIPRGTTLKKIADYFGVDVDYLLGNEKKPDVFVSYKSDNKEVKSMIEIMSPSKVHMIPVFESVSAGFGASAHEEIVDYFPLYINNEFEAKETLIIRVKGDSMYPKIEDGDLIQVHKQESVDSGSVAVVLVDGEEGYVKKVEYGPDWIVLHSFNPMYPPMRFDKSAVLRVRVIGLVRRIIKDM
ncbi:MAG: helix-turn-helix domain-containing protein [Clostridia bacterium]|nr:helix-turn-helix domain-containing protein [Clostridia bacterium]